MTEKEKLIEVALPLEAINAASAREEPIRHGHPSTLHLWLARPLRAAEHALGAVAATHRLVSLHVLSGYWGELCNGSARDPRGQPC
jgi:hypothetical protein